MLISIFGLFIFSPLVVAVITPAETLSTIEKRDLVPFPDFSPDINVLKKFPAEFEQYFNDHFGFREWLIRCYNYIHIFWLKTSPLSKVILGKDGWLYYNSLYYKKDKTTDTCQRMTRLTDLQLKFWKDALETREKWLSEQGIHYLLAIAPDKQSIYPEYLQNYINEAHQYSRTDHFLSYMKNNSNINILDLRIPLKEEKKRQQVYFKTDSHWNHIGAYVACNYIIQNIRSWFPHEKGLKALSFSQISKGEVSGQDLAAMLGLNGVLNEQLVVPVLDTPCAYNISQPADNLLHNMIKNAKDRYSRRRPLVMGCEKAELRCVIFGDSFLYDAIPFLAEHFSQISFIRNRYTRNKAKDLIQQIHPHILIEEFVEYTVVPEPVDYNNLGNTMFIQGKINEAARQYQEALKLEPENPSAHKNLGMVMLRKKNYEQAIAHFKTSLAQKPEDKNTEQLLMSALIMDAEVKTKTAKLRNSLLTGIMDSALHRKLGDIYKSTGQYDKALAHFSLALVVEPESELLLQKIAEIYIYRQNYENALMTLARLTGLNPQRAVYYYNMACIEAIRNNTKQSVAFLETAIQKGYGDFEKIRTDPDLDRLRGTPGYQQLIKKYAPSPKK